MDNVDKFLAAILAGGALKSIHKRGLKGAMDKGFDDTVAAVPMIYMGKNLAGMKNELGEINMTLKQFLMKNGKTPYGVIEFGDEFTANPIAGGGGALPKPPLT